VHAVDRLDHIKSELKSDRARAAVIGLGYVGLPLAVALAESGYHVTGIDNDRQKVDAINKGLSHVEDIPDSTVRELVDEGRLLATTDFSSVTSVHAISICVPTPLRKSRDPDMSYIVSAVQHVAEYIQPGTVLVLESTTYPGTTTELVRPLVEGGRRDLIVGETVFLAFSPERVDPGRTDWTTKNTPKVIGGETPSCLAAAMAYYGRALPHLVPVSSTQAAEMVKLLENTFRAVNIGLANEVLIMCDKLGLDAWEIIDAAATKPFGFMRFSPGPGLGGHCIPIDPLYLSWRLKSLSYNARFIELASEINTEMPRYWTRKIQDVLNDQGKAVRGSCILILGVAYKKNVRDVRESPAVDIIKLLQEKGARVQFHDPFVESLEHEGVDVRAVHSLEDGLRQADCTVIVTDHSIYDWNFIRQHSSVLVDTRHVFEDQSLRSTETVSPA
jgi:UDP-N-acetyl-D-glucosamine dehydrogenase